VHQQNFRQTSKFACDKCHVEGEWNQKVTFQETNAPLRTDAEFAEKSDPDHHLGHSIIPREFARKPRSFNEIMRWKATELRQFMLYTGPVVLKNVLYLYLFSKIKFLLLLPDSLYQNFLLFSVAMTILLSHQLCGQVCSYAKQLLVVFVENMKALYGKEMIVYNVDGLIHLADDARNFGPLDNFSSFPFDNTLKVIKKLIHKPNFPLQQLAKERAQFWPFANSFSAC